MFDESVRSDAVAPLLHIAEIVGGPTFEQPKTAGDGQTVDHTGSAAFFVAGAASVEDAVLDFALERVPLPFVHGADADSVDVAVVDEYAFTVADSADGVAH